jgi:heme exporter protein A
VFSDINLIAESGQLIVLSGPNGSGKTSLIKIVAGVLEPRSGTVELIGEDGRLSVGEHAHLVGHSPAIKPALTVRENLKFWASFLGSGDPEAGLEGFGLGMLADLPAGVLSAGQQRRLGLARLLAVRRPVWLLDEPAVGLDDASQRQLSYHMDEHLKLGGIIIAATHADLKIQCSFRIELGASG